MPTIQIKSRFVEPSKDGSTDSNKVLWEGASPSLKEALQSAVKSGAYLQGANLHGANLHGAYLQGANLRNADLQGAYLYGAYLQGAYLQGADLQGAYLQGADLQGADLQGADLQGADLQGANLKDAKLPHFQIVPEKGEFIAYKKVSTGIVELLISKTAKRTSSLVGRKCRASHAKVLNITSLDKKKKFKTGHSSHNVFFKYEVGKIVKVTDFNDDIRIECTAGIHFFITRKEAEEY